MFEDTTADYQSRLIDLLYSEEAVDIFGYISQVRTFEESGVMSTDKGLIVQFANGSEFYLTIVQSKEAN